MQSWDPLKHVSALPAAPCWGLRRRPRRGTLRLEGKARTHPSTLAPAPSALTHATLLRPGGGRGLRLTVFPTSAQPASLPPPLSLRGTESSNRAALPLGPRTAGSFFEASKHLKHLSFNNSNLFLLSPDPTGRAPFPAVATF